MNRIALTVVLCLIGAEAIAAEPHTGPWRGWLDSPGGELPFGLNIAKSGEKWSASIINGKERIDVPIVRFEGRELLLHIDYYDSKIIATPSANGAELQGQWVKRAAGGGWTRMAFHAKAGTAPRFASQTSNETTTTQADLTGRWSVRFSGSEEKAVAEFECQPDGTVTGTFMTTTGDYRFLAGSLDSDRLRLSCFDGAHAFLFDARALPDGTLKGDFWSRDTWHETWTARRDESAELPDAFAMTRWTGERSGDDLFFPDLEGRRRSPNVPAFRGKARLIEIFGSWCPNCHDAGKYLVELERRYGDRGFKVLGLAFELTGEFSRDAAQVRTYMKRHGLTYPVLIAGISNKKKASAALPVLDKIRAYPTTIFMDARGQVRGVHTGFFGPATGESHRKLRAKFEGLIEEMLAD